MGNACGTAPEPSDAPASQRSTAPDLARDDQANSCFVAESNPAVKVGPWGGKGGEPWDDGASFDGIRQITVYSWGCIDAIEVEYTKNGTLVLQSKHGGNGGRPTEFKLRPHEYITKVTGHYGEFEGLTVLRSLKFTTNQRTFGPVGPEEGTAFGLPVVDAHFVGFFGCSAKYLDAIGVYIVSN